MAETWDELKERVNSYRDRGVCPFLILNKLLDAGDELKKKADTFDAVKNHFNLVNKHRNDQDDLPDYHAYRRILNSIWFTELGEILEDVDFDEENI